MDVGSLDFLLTEIHALAFVNPFGKERDRIEAGILTKMGFVNSLIDSNPIFTKEFNQVLQWVWVGEQALLDGKVKEFESSHSDRMASLAYFSLYHEIVDDLDRLIEGPEGDSIANRKLFRRIEEGIRKRSPLIRGMGNPMWGNPGHLFSCFYQLRRAFLCLFQEIVGQSDPIRSLRMRVEHLPIEFQQG